MTLTSKNPQRETLGRARDDTARAGREKTMHRFLRAAAVAAAIAAGAALLASPALAVKGGPKNAAQDAEIDALQADIGFLLLQHARLVFVTEGTYTGNLIAEAANLGLDASGTGLEAGDAICQDEAEADGLVGDFTAWLSDGVPTGEHTNAKDRLTDTGLPYILVDTTAIADDLTDLTATGADNALDLDAFGALQAGLVWTGTHPSRLAALNNCTDWSNAGNISGLTGDSGASGNTWTSGASPVCSEFHRLYCFQQ